MSWSPLQREILDAMGLAPMQWLAAAPPGTDADAMADAATGKAAATSVAAAVASHGRNPQAPSRAVDAAAGLDAMTRALLRAAGAQQARDAVLALCPMPQALRGDPRAKRALWPQLRALRRR